MPAIGKAINDAQSEFVSHASPAENLRLLLEGVRDYGMVMIDLEGRVITWNAGAESLFGYGSEEIIGHHLSRVYLDKDGALDSEMARATKEGTFETEGWRVRKDGSRFLASALTTPLRDRGGRVLGFLRITRDLTESKRAEAALKRQSALINLALDAIFVHDMDRKIIFWNRGAEELYGWKEAEVLGRSPHDLLETKFPRSLEEIRAELLAKDRWEGELAHKTRSGRRVDVISRWSLQRDESGEPIAILEITRDITERKRAEDELRKLAAELERRVAQRTAELREANDELESFAYSVSHDLRAPLRAMGGLSQALLEDYGDRLDELGKDYAEHIRASAEHMDRLILDLLAYSRLSRERILLSPVPLVSVAEEALRQLDADIRCSGAAIEIQTPLPIALAHRQTLVQMIANLIGNAIKFVPQGVTPSVRLRAETEGERVRLWVEDNGIGVAPEHHERIFKVFERLHGIEAYPGTGIGLSIVRKGAQRMNGGAGIESTLGEGSRFWLELQRAP